MLHQRKRNLWQHVVAFFSSSYFYRPKMKLRQDNAFTPVCDSVHVGVQGVSVQRGLCQGDPRPYSEEQAVRILLECIRVHCLLAVNILRLVQLRQILHYH